MSKENKKQKKFIEVIRELEEVIITQSGADVFSEIFKLIFAKLIDELDVKNRGYKSKFVGLADFYKNVIVLFEKARVKWPSVFAPQEKFNLNRECTKNCFEILENINVLDYSIAETTDAFEYILPDVVKKKRGQYFTPEHVVELMINVLKPESDELVIDPACGSGGYLINSLNLIYKNSGNKKVNLKNIYGVDTDDKSIKIAQAIKIIAGKEYDYNLKKLDTINSLVWEGLSLKKHRFDCLLTNPPFSGDVNDKSVLENYELAFDEKDKLKPRMDRHILFLERIIDLLKPGGRAAVILPQGVLNNKNMASVRKYLLSNTQVFAIISLDRNIFRPYTDTKTSIVFFRRWQAGDDRTIDYSVFMAVTEKSGKDHLGRPIYIKNSKISNGNSLELDHDLNDILIEYLKVKKE